MKGTVNAVPFLGVYYEIRFKLDRSKRDRGKNSIFI